MYFCGCRKTSFTTLRWKIIDDLIEIYWDKVLKLPNSEAEFLELSSNFEKKTGLKDFFGAIDGLLAHITLPVGTKNARYTRPYYCYKKFYALNLQGVTEPNEEFSYANVGHVGATCVCFTL